MIQNAKDTPLFSNPGTLPNMQDALADWFQMMTFTIITKETVDHELVETATVVAAKAVRQPLSAQKLMMKPEGQRAWRWEQLHAFPDLILKPDDVVVFNGIRYRVMDKLDYKEYGYLEYHITQDYT